MFLPGLLDIFNYIQEKDTLPKAYRRKIFEVLHAKTKDLPEDKKSFFDKVLMDEIRKLDNEVQDLAKGKRSISGKIFMNEAERRGEIREWAEALGDLLRRLSKDWEPVSVFKEYEQ